MMTFKTIATDMSGIEETRLLADSGMIVLRQQDDGIRLGISQVSDTDEEPEVEIALTTRQLRGLLEELSWYREHT